MASFLAKAKRFSRRFKQIISAGTYHFMYNLYNLLRLFLRQPLLVRINDILVSRQILR